MARIKIAWFVLIRGTLAAWRLGRIALWWTALKATGQTPTYAAIGRRSRMAMERMGITYVKLGQFLAIRFDLVPPDIARELSLLFDTVSPVGLAQIRSVVREELGKDVDDLFARFETECVAAASVAQVHKAVLYTGEAVAVKIQRPHVSEVFAADIRFFRLLAWLVDHLRPIGAISLVEGLRQFEAYTAREMDFRLEAATCEHVRRMRTPRVTAPKPFWALTTERVLTMEFVAGIAASELIRLIEMRHTDAVRKALPGVRIEEVVRRLANACFRQIFDEGFFHADPHPGNIIVQSDGTVVFIDFGIFGQLTRWELDTLSQFVASAALGNVPATLHYFSKLVKTGEQTDLARFHRDLSAVVFRWQGAVSDVATGPEVRHFGRYVNEFMAAARKHRAGMSLDTLLFWRTLIALNGTALRLDPSTDVLNLLAQFFSHRRGAALARRLSYEAVASALADAARHVRPSGYALRHAEMQYDRAAREARDAWVKQGAAIAAGTALLAFSAVLDGRLFTGLLVVAFALVMREAWGALRHRHREPGSGVSLRTAVPAKRCPCVGGTHGASNSRSASI